MVESQNLSAEFQATRQRILQFGWNTTCYQVLNPGLQHWLEGDAAVGFVRRNGVNVVAGAPVCPEEDLPACIQEFEGRGPAVYFGAEERVHNFAVQADRYSISVMGAQPVWSPESWADAVDGDPSLRAQLNRARNKGVTVSLWTEQLQTRKEELLRVLDEWLQTRGLPTMHFLVEPDTSGFLADRQIYVAEREGKVIGFTTLCPIPQRSGWLTEQFVRGRDAVNGTVELLVDTAIRQVGRDGSQMVTMGMVPLSRMVPQMESDPWWLRFAMNWVRAHGRRFYNFDGLEWFKNKFHPDRWDPIYVISTHQPFPPRHLYAAAAAFTGMPPWLSIIKGFARGVTREMQWALGR